MKKYIITMFVLLVWSSMAWGQASLTVEAYPEKFVKAGEDFWFNIQIRNTGDDTAYNVEVNPTYDSNITTAAATSAVGDLAAEEYWLMNLQVAVNGATTDQTQMTSSFEVTYENNGGTPYTPVTVEVKNRVFTDDVEEQLVTGLVADQDIDHFDINSDGSQVIYSLLEAGTGHGPPANANIWMINADGTGKTQLTNDPDCETDPMFSPDDTKFVYKANVNMGTVPDATYDPTDDYNSDIYVMDLATKANTQLTSDGDCQLSPIWSPDGTKILFRDDHRVKASDDTYSRLWIMDADGSNQMELSGLYGGNHGSFSPDGEWIFYSESNNATPTDSVNVWKVRPDGTDATQLTFTDDACEQWARISPDGQWILFHYYYEKEAGDWYNSMAVMDTSGANLTILLEQDYAIYDVPHDGIWSPDGRWILFGYESMQNDPGSHYDSTWIIDKRNRYKANLSSGYDERKRQWCPDGTYFLFVDDDRTDNRTPDNADVWRFDLDTQDPDEDDLANWEEDVVGTDQDNFDTDGDSAGDGREFDQGSNPLVADCPGVATLTATAGDGQVDLSWEAPAKSGAIASYTLFRGETAGGPYEELEAGIDGTAYTDTTVTNGTTYYYVVVAVDADEFMGGDSNEAEATPQAETDDDTGDDDTGDDDDDAAGGDDDDDDDDGCCGC